MITTKEIIKISWEKAIGKFKYFRDTLHSKCQPNIDSKDEHYYTRWMPSYGNGICACISDEKGRIIISKDAALLPHKGTLAVVIPNSLVNFIVL